MQQAVSNHQRMWFLPQHRVRAAAQPPDPDMLAWLKDCTAFAGFDRSCRMQHGAGPTANVTPSDGSSEHISVADIPVSSPSILISSHTIFQACCVASRKGKIGLIAIAGCRRRRAFLKMLREILCDECSSLPF